MRPLDLPPFAAQATSAGWRATQDSSRQRRQLLLAALAGPALASLPVGLARAASGDPQTEALLRAQREALAPLAKIDGLWRGPARARMPDGSELRMTQTERVGPMLDGSIRVIEGRGHLPDGTLVFHAFAVIGFDPGSRRYHFRSWAQGRSGEFSFELRPKGFSWSTPAGPGRARPCAMKPRSKATAGTRPDTGSPKASRRSRPSR